MKKYRKINKKLNGLNMKYVLLILAVCLMFQVTYASQEGMLGFSQFKIVSKGIGHSGKIIVKGEQDVNGKYKQISIDAFGKILKVPKKILKKMPKYYNGIQLSYETGYKTRGGRTIYIIFFTGFTSGIKEKFTISVCEEGKVDIIKF